MKKIIKGHLSVPYILEIDFNKGVTKLDKKFIIEEILQEQIKGLGYVENNRVSAIDPYSYRFKITSKEE